MTDERASSLPTGTYSMTGYVYGYDTSQPPGSQSAHFPMSEFAAASAILSSGGAPVTTLGATMQSNSGTLDVVESSFSSLAVAGSLTAATQLLVVQNGTAYSTTLGALVLEIGVLTAPSIAITTIPGEVVNQPFTVTGTLTNYSAAPTLTYADNGGSYAALPGGAIVTSNSFTFTHPGLAAGSDTVSVRDANGVTGTSNSFLEATITATAATIAGAPANGVVGAPITGLTCTLTPAGATGYAALTTGGVDQGARVAFTGTVPPVFTPAAAATDAVAIYAAPTGGSALTVSSDIVVSAVVATAATITGAPATGSKGTPLPGLTCTLTPSGALAYAVLRVGGADEGARVSFTGTAVPSLTPTATGNYVVALYAAATGGSPLCVSATTAVSGPQAPQVNGTSPNLHLDASATGGVTSDAAFATPQTINGGPVRGWVDQTTNHYSFAQTTTGSSFVTNAKNGLSGILLSKTDQLNGPLALATAIQAIVKGSTGGVTFAFVGLVSDITRITTIFGVLSTTQVFGIIAGGNPGFNVEGTNNFIGSSLTYQRIICTVNAAAKTFSLAFNGGLFQTQAYTLTSDTAASAAPYIGAAYAQATDVTVLEEIIWPALAMQSDVTAIDAYLTTKWGT